MVIQSIYEFNNETARLICQFFLCITSKNGKTNFKNVAANTSRFLKLEGQRDKSNRGINLRGKTSQQSEGLN